VITALPVEMPVRFRTIFACMAELVRSVLYVAESSALVMPQAELRYFVLIVRNDNCTERDDIFETYTAKPLCRIVKQGLCCTILWMITSFLLYRHFLP
jgi:hypothetical protein